MQNFLAFRFMMFSERLEHGKYDFQHLQGTVSALKPAQFRGFSMIFQPAAVWDPNNAPPLLGLIPNFRSIDFRRFLSKKIWSKIPSKYAPEPLGKILKIYQVVKVIIIYDRQLIFQN